MSMPSQLFEDREFSIVDLGSIPDEIINAVFNIVLSFTGLIICTMIFYIMLKCWVKIVFGYPVFNIRIKELNKKTTSAQKSILKNFDYTINLASLSRSERKLVIRLIQDIEAKYLFLKKQTRSVDSLKYRVEIQNVLIVSKELIHSFCNEPKLMIASEFESFQYKDLEALGQLCQAYSESYEIEKKLHGNPKFECELEKLEEYIALRADQVTQNYIQYKQTKLNEQLQY